jgi:hypothetical protein
VPSTGTAIPGQIGCSPIEGERGENETVQRNDDRPRKRFPFRRASLLVALTTLLLAAGYGFAVFALTRTGNAAVIGVGSSEPSSVPFTTSTNSSSGRNPKSKCSGHGTCQGPADVSSDGVFLCYSKFQTEPGVWPQDQAMDLLAEGYWPPVAVAGNVEGGPNVGAYHLVCNATGAPTGKVVNENGEVLDGSPTDGYYALIG